MKSWKIIRERGSREEKEKEILSGYKWPLNKVVISEKRRRELPLGWRVPLGKYDRNCDTYTLMQTHTYTDAHRCTHTCSQCSDSLRHICGVSSTQSRHKAWWESGKCMTLIMSGACSPVSKTQKTCTHTHTHRQAWYTMRARAKNILSFVSLLHNRVLICILGSISWSYKGSLELNSLWLSAVSVLLWQDKR